MIAIRSRKYGSNNDQVMLSVRIKDAKHDKAVALGISVNTRRWESIDETLKNARIASKRGTSMFIDDPLASMLWQLLKELSALQAAGKLNDKMTAKTINDIIRKEDVELAKVVEQREKELKAVNKPTFVKFVEQYISECESGERLKQKSTKKITHGTIKGLKVFLMHLKAYQKSRKKIIDWDDLTLDFYKDFKQYFIERDYNPNTIAGHIKRTKTVLAAAKDLHLTTRDDFMSRQWSVDFEEVENIYISKERLREMAGIDLNDAEEMTRRAALYAKDEEEREKLTSDLRRDLYRKNLSEARDVFVMGCLTGQRVSDYKRIDASMVETIIGDRKFIHLKQQKTGKDVYISYEEMIPAILERYDGKLPKVFDQDLNERIKVVGLLCGWTEPAGLQERHGLMTYPSKKRFCDAIMTHTARRSFATNAYKSGVPLSAIMAITGHSSEEMLKKYLKLGSKERALLAAAEFDKVKMM